MAHARWLGANWVSVTPFGRVYDLAPTGVSLDYEASFATNKTAVQKAVAQAHSEGLRVMLVPHLWVETGAWRGEIDPGDDEAWKKWTSGYRRFVVEWAKVARDAGVELFVVGVELRTWVTTQRATSFAKIIREVRRIYPGMLTYAANWDDVVDTVILGQLDLIGVNAFFPLAEHKGASLEELVQKGALVKQSMKALAELWERPILFTEFGYTARPDPTLEPWLWPEHLAGQKPDQAAQADAYRALLASFMNEPWFAGAFVWRVFSDRYDLSQEPEWGFSPRGKLAEMVLEDAYRAYWAADGRRPVGTSLYRFGSDGPGVFSRWSPF